MIAVVARSYTEYLKFTKNIKNPRPYYYITGVSDLKGRKLIRVVGLGGYYQRDDWRELQLEINHMIASGDIQEGLVQA